MIRIFDYHRVIDDYRLIVYLNDCNSVRMVLINDDKYDGDDDVNEFVFHFVLSHRIILYLLIHLKHILIHLMFDEY